MSPTFGAALWTMDYALRATLANISRTYFHHGTVGNCKYCFWGRSSTGAPYYGAYAAVALLAGASHLAALDDGSGPYAGYVAFDGDDGGKPIRALLYNSDYYAATGTSSSRTNQSFVLTGLPAGKAKLLAKRLTAAGGATARQDQGDRLSFGGQSFADGSCAVTGDETFETVDVDDDGTATVTVRATEALLVYL